MATVLMMREVIDAKEQQYHYWASMQRHDTRARAEATLHHSWR